MEYRQRMLFGSSLICIVLILLGVLSMDVGILGNLLLISILVFASTLFLIKYAYYTWLKALEMQFPNFVRDLSDSIRSGMSMKQAIILASKTNYGKLSAEIKSMAAKLSWDIPVLRVLEIFQKRISGSRLMSEAVDIMKEAYTSGGDVAATLDSIARDMMMFKEIEAERESMARGHIIIMYGIFFMFVGIALMIIFIMVPMIKAGPQEMRFGFGFGNPCENFLGFPCNYYQLLGSALGVPQGVALYYVSLFFTIVIIQGIFMGFIVGQLGESSVLAGAKHSLIMVITALAIFLFIIRAGLIPV